MHPPKSYLLYFQQLRPLSKCVAGDGRVVGHLLIDLIESKPTDQTHAVRTFSNRMAMLRECGFRIGAFLVALLSPEHASVTPPKSNVLGGPQDPAAVSEEQATVLGRTLAAAIPPSAAYCAADVLKAVNLHLVLRKMTSKYAWLVPLLEVLLVHATDRSRSTVSRRLSSVVTPAGIASGYEATELAAPVETAEAAEAAEATIAGEPLRVIHVATSTEGAYDGSFDSVVRLPSSSLRMLHWHPLFQ
jgi:hypothetical protein